MAEQLVITEAGATQLLEVAEQGPPGPPGPAGAAGSSVVQAIAAVALSGHVVVAYNTAGQLVPASAAELLHALRVAGITVAAAVLGASVAVQQREVLEHAGWAWVPGQPVFLGLGGALVQTPAPGAVFMMLIGQALTATRLLVNPQPALILT